MLLRDKTSNNLKVKILSIVLFVTLYLSLKFIDSDFQYLLNIPTEALLRLIYMKIYGIDIQNSRLEGMVWGISNIILSMIIYCDLFSYIIHNLKERQKRN